MNDFNFELYKKNVYSEHGEDGIIEEIFKRLDSVSDKKCCEFGAWDGKFLSNTYNLITNYNFEALLIEGNKKKFKELEKNFPEKRIIKINKFINFTGENSIDNILKKNHWKKDFDFLSIDIDGCDYYILKSLSLFTPKLICIEFNPTIPNSVNFVQEKNIKVHHGSSAKSLIDLAIKKDYFPIASTENNLFFIYNKFKKFITTSNQFDIERLLPSSNQNFIFCGYDGTILTSKPLKLIWHGIIIKKISYLPSILNKFRGNYNVFERIIFVFYTFFHDPILHLKKKKMHLIKVFYENLIGRNRNDN